MSEDSGDNGKEVQLLKSLQEQVIKLVHDLQQTTDSFELLENVWKQRDRLSEEIKVKNNTIQRLEQRIDDLETLPSESTKPSVTHVPSAPDEQITNRFLDTLTTALTKIFVNSKVHENLPIKLIQSIEDTEAIIIEEGTPEMKVIVALGRAGGTAAPSNIKSETTLTQGEVDKALAALQEAGMILEEMPGVFQLTAMKTMDSSISQWSTIASVSEIFSHCKHFIQASNDPSEIAEALDVLRDALFTKGASGVVVSEIAKEARAWRTDSGDKESLLEHLTAWKERTPI